MRLLLAFLILLSSVSAHAALSDCEKRLMRVLGRVAPEDQVKTLAASVTLSEVPHHPEVEKFLRPDAQVEVGKQGALDISVRGPIPFAIMHQKLKKRGFWMIMNPNPASQRLATGHATIVIGDHLFTRFSDDLGPEAMRSVSAEEIAALFMKSDETPFVVAQFYELPETSVEALDDFFHKRVWNYHARIEGWGSRYERLPLASELKGVECENCSLFCWSFLDPKWIALHPSLQAVQSQIGPMKVTQVPILQIHNNTKTPAYRGTVLLTKDPVNTLKGLQTGAFAEDPVGAQTLFHNFKEIAAPSTVTPPRPGP